MQHPNEIVQLDVRGLDRRRGGQTNSPSAEWARVRDSQAQVDAKPKTSLPSMGPHRRGTARLTWTPLFFCKRTEIYNGPIAIHCEGIAEAFSIQIATKISRTTEKNVQPSRKAFAEMCNVSLPSISALCLVRIHPLNRKPGAVGWLRDVVCTGGSNVNLENSTKIVSWWGWMSCPSQLKLIHNFQTELFTFRGLYCKFGRTKSAPFWDRKSFRNTE